MHHHSNLLTLMKLILYFALDPGYGILITYQCSESNTSDIHLMMTFTQREMMNN